jgi:hypothetical protein
MFMFDIYQVLAPPAGIEPTPSGSKPEMISISPKRQLVLPPGIEPGSTVLQTAAMTTSAKVAFVLGRSTGIEPVIAESQPAVLPLN